MGAASAVSASNRPSRPAQSPIFAIDGTQRATIRPLEYDYLTEQISVYLTDENEIPELEESQETSHASGSRAGGEPVPPLQELLTKFQENIDVVIVGAGPCGLWTAIQIKTLSPNARIVILEKHEQYKRHHVLRLSKGEIAPDHPALHAILREFPSVIRTSALEERLYQHSVQVGVTKFYYAVVDPTELECMFPSATIFIGADGAGSVMREQLFGGIGFNQTLRCLAFFKYEVKGHGKEVQENLSNYYALLKSVNHIVTEHVGHEKDGRTPITCQIFVSEEEHAAMAHAKFSAPFLFPRDLEQLPPAFLQTLTVWLNYKTLNLSEERIRGSETLVSIKLNNYRAARVSQQSNGKFYFLVGDAASGIPFFRALNFGFMCANKLAMAVSEILSPQLTVEQPESSGNSLSSLKMFSKIPSKRLGVKGYQSYFDDAIASEFAKSSLKNKSIDFGDSLLGFERKINAIVPSSLIMMKIPKEEFAVLAEMDPFPDASTGSPKSQSHGRLALVELNSLNDVSLDAINTNASTNTNILNVM